MATSETPEKPRRRTPAYSMKVQSAPMLECFEDSVSEVLQLAEEVRESADNMPSGHPKADAFNEAADILESGDFPDFNSVPKLTITNIADWWKVPVDWSFKFNRDKRRSSSRATRLSNSVSCLEAACDKLEDWVGNATPQLTLNYSGDPLSDMVREIEEMIDQMRIAVEAVEDTDFPGMFG